MLTINIRTAALVAFLFSLTGQVVPGQMIETLQGKDSQAHQDFDKAFKIDPSLKPRFKEFIENRRRNQKP